MQADEIMRNGQADMVLLGREMLREQVRVPEQYLRAY